MAEIFCNDVNPSFGFGPNATRSCREDGTWSRVDTSQCTISPTQQQSTIVMYSTYVEVATVNGTENITSPEIEEVNTYIDAYTYICIVHNYYVAMHLSSLLSYN